VFIQKIALYVIGHSDKAFEVDGFAML